MSAMPPALLTMWCFINSVIIIIIIITITIIIIVIYLPKT